MDAAAALVEQLAPVVSDERVLATIASTPRERFVPASEAGRAYENIALPIGCGQTISQPLVVARMLEMLELRASDRVLDIGTGSGYHAALLARLAAHVWTVERYRELSEAARAVLETLGLDNVTCVVGDGCDGLPGEAPFDAINVAAAAEGAAPATLEAQLAQGGRMVVPVGGAEQYLVLTRRTPSGLQRMRFEAVRFVPLVPGCPPEW